jgi:pilus assembly protein Flp/PilA
VVGTSHRTPVRDQPPRLTRDPLTRIRQYIYWGECIVINSVSARIAAAVQSRLVRDDEGATAVEYGLIVGLIAVVIIAAVILLGQNLNGMFTTINDELGTTP